MVCKIGKFYAIIFPILFCSNTSTTNIKLNTYNNHTVNKITNSMKEKVAPINAHLGNISSEELMDSYNGIKC